MLSGSFLEGGKGNLLLEIMNGFFVTLLNPQLVLSTCLLKAFNFIIIIFLNLSVKGVCEGALIDLNFIGVFLLNMEIFKV